MKTVTTVASRPMTIEIRVAWTVRFRIDRPSSSVPSGNAADGGSKSPTGRRHGRLQWADEQVRHDREAA